jgi:hypothetical protein
MIEHLADVTLPTLYAFVLMLIVHWMGVLRERHRGPRPVYKPPPSLHCGCGDELSFHDGLGRCTKMDTKWVGKDPGTGENMYVDRPCGCQQYTGDLPEDWFSRESMREIQLLPLPQLPAQKEENG